MPVILAFIAHPDDESYSFGGTLALAALRGWRCIVCSVTNGEFGERHDGGPPGPMALAVTREAELAASCAALGIERPITWGLPDGGLANIPGPRARIARVIRDHTPDIVLSLGPDGAYGHPDHLAVVRWVTAAVMRLGSDAPALLHTAFPPGLFLPQYERCLAAGIMGDPPAVSPADLGQQSAHYTVDITAVREAKLAAIAAHESQLPGGDPYALFPGGIVEALLDSEGFRTATGIHDSRVARLLSSLTG